MKITLTVSTLIAMFVFSNSSLAADKGFYIGGALSSSGFTDGGFGDAQTNTALDKKSSNGSKIYVGYMFGKIAGIEVTYANHGKFSYLNTSTNTTRTEVKPTSISVASNLGYTFSNGFRPFAVVGLGSISMNQSGPSKLYSNDNAGVFHFGFGGQWEPKSLAGLGFRVGVDYDMFFIKQTSVYYSSSSNQTYTNLITNAYAGIQYKF